MVEKSGFPLMAFILEVATGYDITILEERERKREGQKCYMRSVYKIH